MASVLTRMMAIRGGDRISKKCFAILTPYRNVTDERTGVKTDCYDIALYKMRIQDKMFTKPV